MRFVPTVAAALAMAAPAFAFAQNTVTDRIREAPEITTRRDPGPATQPYAETSAARELEHLIGQPVLDPKGQELGDVENLLVRPDGQVAGLVVEWGTLPAVTGNQVAVPWRDVRLSEDRRTVTLGLTRDQLEKAPKYDPDTPAAAGVDPDVKPLR